MPAKTSTRQKPRFESGEKCTRKSDSKVFTIVDVQVFGSFAGAGPIVEYTVSDGISRFLRITEGHFITLFET